MLKKETENRVLKILLVAASARLIYGISSGIRANYGVILSSWLGGVCVRAIGGYTLIWCVAMLLSAAAATLAFCVNEPKAR